MIDKRARQFIIRNRQSEDSEGTWRVDDTFVLQTASEEIFISDLQFLDNHKQIATIVTYGFHDTHWEIEIRWTHVIGD